MCVNPVKCECGNYIIIYIDINVFINHTYNTYCMQPI